MDIKELKIILDWSKENMERASGSKSAFPQIYEDAVQTYKKVRAKFDEECKKWIENNID